MTLASALITRGRGFLQDEDSGSYRWTDAQLLVFLNLGVTEFFKDTRAIRRSVSLGVSNSGNGEILFSTDLGRDDVYMLDKVYWDGTPLYSSSIDDLENQYPNMSTNSWEDETGTPDTFTQDTLGFTGMRLVPIPDVAGILKIWYYSVPAPLLSTDTVNLPFAFENAPMYWMLYQAFSREIDSPGGNNYLSYAKFYKAEYDRLVSQAADQAAWKFNSNHSFIIPHQEF